MRRKMIAAIIAVLLAGTFSSTGSLALAAESTAQEEDGAFFLGSLLFSILHFPVKLATCVGTQATAAVAYVGTYDVHGHYDGGTNGRDIGETARRSCTGSWLVTPSQVKKDYGE